MTNVLFIRDILYRLKQDYGQRMDIYVPCPGKRQDFSTGKQYIEFRRIGLKTVLLPGQLQNRFVHDVSFLTAGRNFAYGGLFQEGVHDILVDGIDIPKGVTLDTGIHIIYRDNRYDIMMIEELEHKVAWAIKMKKVNKGPLYQERYFNVTTPFFMKEVVLNG